MTCWDAYNRFEAWADAHGMVPVLNQRGPVYHVHWLRHPDQRATLKDTRLGVIMNKLAAEYPECDALAAWATERLKAQIANNQCRVRKMERESAALTKALKGVRNAE